MDARNILKKVNSPIGIFRIGGAPLFLSGFFKEILKSYGNIFSFLEIDVENSAYNRGLSLEKRLFLNGETKFFVFYIQRIDKYIFIKAIDITYNIDLINAIIERSDFLSGIVATSTVGVYTKELKGGFIYKNQALENFMEKLEYPDMYFLNKVLETGIVVDVREVIIDGKEKFIFEYGRVVESKGKTIIRGFVIFDTASSDFFRDFTFYNRVLSEIFDLSQIGIIFFSKDCLKLEFYNKFAEDVLSKEIFEKIAILGIFEPNILFDENTISLIREGLGFNGEYELFNYKIPNIEGEFDFSFFEGNLGFTVFLRRVLPAEEKSACRQFKSMFEYASDAILLIKDNIFMECNKKALELFGCRKEDIIGKTPFHFSPEFQPDGLPSEEATIKMLDTATVSGNKVFEWVHKRCDGSLFDAEVTLSKIQIDGYTYTQAIVRDISARKRDNDLGKILVD